MPAHPKLFLRSSTRTPHKKIRQGELAAVGGRFVRARTCDLIASGAVDRQALMAWLDSQPDEMLVFTPDEGGQDIVVVAQIA